MARYPDDTPNLLIVDDDETIQRLLVIAAKDHGWRPVAASTGKEAVALAGDATEMVVLDHGLPDMDGISTLVQLRERHPDARVLIVGETAPHDTPYLGELQRLAERHRVTHRVISASTPAEW